ncbi:MAG: aspartate--ammonia ligase [Acholeplasmatales bacterium]
MYKSKLNMKETQKAIKILKDNFERKLAETLNLDRVSAPIIVSSKEGINDDLGIKDSALSFHVPSLNKNIEIVQSLAKWKRMALGKYGYHLYEGIYTDMNAIRIKDVIDQTHSLYVDQWDWELVIKKEDRNINFLKKVVNKIVKAIKETKVLIKNCYPILNEEIEEEVYFISSHDLVKKYPNLTLKEREREITKLHKTVFITEISPKYDLRAPDYDDWLLNGDLLVWSKTIDDAIELSSMGIRVDKKRLLIQMEESNRFDELNAKYYQQIINDEIPLTIGGGIGQSRLCLVLLEKLHIAEVQASIWNSEEHKFFQKHNINYL